MLVQTGGTCYLYAVLNSLAMTTLGKNLLKSKMDPTSFLFSYLNNFWKGSPNQPYKKGTSPNLIKNLNMTNTCEGGMSSRAQKQIFDKLGIKYKTLDAETDCILLKLNNKKRIYSTQYGDFILTSVFIAIYWTKKESKGIHVITGVKLPNGTYVIVDSKNKIFSCDWRDPNILESTLREKYRYIFDWRYRTATYIKASYSDGRYTSR